MGFSRQEYWNGLPCPPPGDLPNPGAPPNVPKTIFCDREIEEGCLSLQFWLIVRIYQFCVKDKTKVVVKFTFFISNLDIPKGGITQTSGDSHEP